MRGGGVACRTRALRTPAAGPPWPRGQCATHASRAAMPHATASRQEQRRDKVCAAAQSAGKGPQYSRCRPCLMGRRGPWPDKGLCRDHSGRDCAVAGMGRRSRAGAGPDRGVESCQEAVKYPPDRRRLSSAPGSGHVGWAVGRLWAASRDGPRRGAGRCAGPCAGAHSRLCRRDAGGTWHARVAARHRGTQGRLEKGDARVRQTRGWRLWSG